MGMGGIFSRRNLTSQEDRYKDSEDKEASPDNLRSAKKLTGHGPFCLLLNPTPRQLTDKVCLS